MPPPAARNIHVGFAAGRGDRRAGEQGMVRQARATTEHQQAKRQPVRHCARRNIVQRRIDQQHRRQGREDRHQRLRTAN